MKKLLFGRILLTAQLLWLSAAMLLMLASFGTAFSPSCSRGVTRCSTAVKANLATAFILEEHEKEYTALSAHGGTLNDGSMSTRSAANHQQPSSSSSYSSSKKKMSRPERKALERAQKQEKKQNGNTKSSSGNQYLLRSQAVSSLSRDSTADDVLRAIKRAQNLRDIEDLKTIEKFLLEEVEANFAYGYRGSLLSRLAVAALHMNDHELARRAMDVRRTEYRSSMLPLESAAIIRGLLRVNYVTDALEVLEDELSLPLQGTSLTDSANQERLKWRALALCSIASRHFFEGEPSMSVIACEKLTQLGPMVREAGLLAEDLQMPWSRLLLGATQCEAGRRNGTITAEIDKEIDLPCNLVYSVLNAMTTFPSDNNDEVYERLSNALVRRVVFLTGAVNMKGCPPPGRGEAAFIGRSNVGKSSLINMITNRKSLAYTSKRPGKTQQFNFFAINDKPGREKEIKYGDNIPGEADLDSFYIADLPGFGFAKVPQQQRNEWSKFMAEYLSDRRNLRVVFHLVDSRHGPTEEDKKIMKQVSQSLPGKANYVVVLTKADKNIKGAAKDAQGKVSKDVMHSLRDAMNHNGVGKRPVILSSSETKLGRDDLWRYLRLAAET